MGDEPGVLATYSGTVTPERYLDKPWRAGQVASSNIELLADGSQQLRLEARIEGEALPASVSDGTAFIAAGALNLNGTALSEFALDVGELATGDAVVNWLEQNIEEHALALAEMRGGKDRHPRLTVRTVEKPARFERLAFQPGREAGCREQVVEAHRQLESFR